VAAHTERSGRPERTLLLAIAADPEQAAQALAGGADLIDASGATPESLAVIGASPAGAVLWDGSPAAPVDADHVAPDDRVAGAVAVAAISTWLGAPAVATRHVRAVRRAIDMTASNAGRRPPALTVRGLA
jgi:hypothetical protein